MKNLIFILLLIGFNSLAAQQVDGFLNAVKSHNYAGLENILQKDITYCEFDMQEYLEKKVAIAKIQRFFDVAKVKSLDKVHSGSSGSTKYQVFKVTTNAKTYRLFLYSEADKITEVRIDNY